MDEFNKIDATQIAETELNTIDLNQVDSYPLFSNCDETASLQTQKLCFEKELHLWLKPFLDTLTLDIEKKDTLGLFMSVDINGVLKQDSITAEAVLKEKLKTIIKSAPKLAPAHKRGIPVKVSFKIPVILNPKTQ